GSRVLICEGCTHHRQCEDIGTVKMPAWVRKHTGAEPTFEFTSGGDFPLDLTPYDLVIHCGGCTLGARAMRGRVSRAAEQGVAITNYGVAIAHMHGILPRVIAPFGL
ncbi:MAG: [Atopobiaceae bacterium]|nr:[FeFe] hydrogenase H-cluster maturation GTPase HydF [Atopobiaceae bacterium]